METLEFTIVGDSWRKIINGLYYATQKFSIPEKGYKIVKPASSNSAAYLINHKHQVVVDHEGCATVPVNTCLIMHYNNGEIRTIQESDAYWGHVHLPERLKSAKLTHIFAVRRKSKSDSLFPKSNELSVSITATGPMALETALRKMQSMLAGGVATNWSGLVHGLFKLSGQCRKSSKDHKEWFSYQINTQQGVWKKAPAIDIPIEVY